MFGYLLEASADPVASATDKILQTGILGAFLVLMGAYAFFATMKWNNANEKRVEDHEKMTATLVSLTTSFRDAMKDLTDSIKTLSSKTDEERQTLAKLETTLDGVVRDAVRYGYRSHSPPHGTPRQGG